MNILQSNDFLTTISYAICATGEGFCTTLYRHFHSRTSRQESLGDICDGSEYQRLVSLGFFSSPNNISVTFNTDGIPVFRSSGFSFWPIYLCINELPYRMRYE